MNPLFRKERESLPHKTMGLERMVPFSSWNLIVFGICFLTMSLIGWYELFDKSAPEILNLLSGILLPMSLGMAMLTSTVVTYVIVPQEVRSERNYDHLFETHEMVMHNWAIILLAVDILLTKPNLTWELAIFGLIVGVIYCIFRLYVCLFWWWVLCIFIHRPKNQVRTDNNDNSSFRNLNVLHIYLDD